jgi:hypothetical protein
MFFVPADGKLMAVAVTTDAGFKAGSPGHAFSDPPAAVGFLAGRFLL